MSDSVASLWRYPVKSMLGESLDRAEVARGGVIGDRAYALIDAADGKAATAKNPRKWPHLLDFRASLADIADRSVPSAVRITLPDGTVVSSDQPDIGLKLSGVLGRAVTLQQAGHGRATSEEYWPDVEGLGHRDIVTDFDLPEGTFFDNASVHIVTTGTLAHLARCYPQGRFEVPRFRPNVVVQTSGGAADFPETAWIGHELCVGDEVRLRVSGACGRCVMTTLAQGDLPGDLGILRTAAERNGASVGVYASVVRGGIMRSGDRIALT